LPSFAARVAQRARDDGGMRNYVDVILRAILFIAIAMVVGSNAHELGSTDGNTSVPPLYEVTGWEPLGLVTKLTMLLMVASTFAFAVVMLPSPRPARRVQWANLGYLLGIAGIATTVVIAAILEELTHEHGSFHWGGGLWLGLVGYAVGGVVCFVVARD
jgi:heme/copper-type cytochrome/quinol oxidase subunit 3